MPTPTQSEPSVRDFQNKYELNTHLNLRWMSVSCPFLMARAQPILWKKNIFFLKIVSVFIFYFAGQQMRNHKFQIKKTAWQFFWLYTFQHSWFKYYCNLFFVLCPLTFSKHKKFHRRKKKCVQNKACCSTAAFSHQHY